MLSTLLPEPGLEIGTADGMQGRENEAVVLSLVRSNSEVQFFDHFKSYKHHNNHGHGY
jgi:superfamily I DNA and/or RNA helicase